MYDSVYIKYHVRVQAHASIHNEFEREREKEREREVCVCVCDLHVHKKCLGKPQKKVWNLPIFFLERRIKGATTSIGWYCVLGC